MMSWWCDALPQYFANEFARGKSILFCLVCMNGHQNHPSSLSLVFAFHSPFMLYIENKGCKAKCLNHQVFQNKIHVI